MDDVYVIFFVVKSNPNIENMLLVFKFLDKEKNMMKEENQFGEEFTLRNPEFSIKERETLLSAAENQGAVFVY